MESCEIKASHQPRGDASGGVSGLPFSSLPLLRLFLPRTRRKRKRNKRLFEKMRKKFFKRSPPPPPPPPIWLGAAWLALLGAQNVRRGAS